MLARLSRTCAFCDCDRRSKPRRPKTASPNARTPASASPRWKARLAGTTPLAPKRASAAAVRGRVKKSRASSPGRGAALTKSVILGEHEAAHELRGAQRGEQAEEGAVGMADEVRRRGAERSDELAQILYVLLHRVVGPLRDRRIRPMPAPAVGEHAKATRERLALALPGAPVAGRAVHEHDRLAATLVAVGQPGTANLDALPAGLHALYPL
jgi:hypothetical protein